MSVTAVHPVGIRDIIYGCICFIGGDQRKIAIGVGFIVPRVQIERVRAVQIPGYRRSDLRPKVIKEGLKVDLRIDRIS